MSDANEKDTTLQDIMAGLAIGAQAIAGGASDPKVRTGARAAAGILLLVTRIMDDRTPEESIEILAKIAKEGVGPIDSKELDEQVAKVVADLASTR